MNKIPTAEEYLQTYFNTGGGRNIFTKEDLIRYGKAFSQLHVEAALKAASEKAKLIWGEDIIEDAYAHLVWVDEQSILNAYPKELIL